MAGYIEEGIFKITSLFISPGYRRHGYATSLIKELRLLLKLYSDVKDMELSFTISHKEHELFIPFLENTGFMQENNLGRTLYILSMEKLIQSSLAKGITKNTSLNFCHLVQFRSINYMSLQK